MATVAESPRSSKAPRAYYAHLFDEAGVLSKVNGELVFFSDAGNSITVEPAMVNFLTVLGEIGLSDCQQIMDRLHGGYAKIACNRAV